MMKETTVRILEDNSGVREITILVDGRPVDHFVWEKYSPVPPEVEALFDPSVMVSK